jgi:hypothetical protein
LRTVLWQWAGDSLTAGELEMLAKTIAFIDTNTEQLNSHLTADEIDATKKRIFTLQANAVMPLPSEDWPAIPWPAY